jgi:putative transposase
VNFELVRTLTDGSVHERCAALGVSEQGYYAHCRKQQHHGVHALRDAELTCAIVAADKVARGTYGTPRLRTALAQDGIVTSRRRIGRLKSTLGLQVPCRRRFVCTTDSKHGKSISPNVLQRDFSATAPNTVWVSDITYLSSASHWLYLCTIVDCFSGAIVGRKLSRAIDAQLVRDTLAMAVRNRQPKPACIFHSDRGSQYASDDFRNDLKKHGFRQSMSRKGDCWDNAVAESSFSRLKAEVGDRFDSDAEAVSVVYEHIDVFHNHIRIHSRHNQSPAAFEANKIN